MKYLAIKGDKNKGNDIIDILTELGADHHIDFVDGTCNKHYYFINKDNNEISCAWVTNPNAIDFKIFTLEEFNKLFPYRIGDKVNIEEGERVITDWKWNENLATIQYAIVADMNIEQWYNPNEIKPFMKKMAIKGDKNKGNEIIKLFESLCALNVHDLTCTDINSYYTINSVDEIVDVELPINNDYITYTIDEFYQKFPYRIGDKVYDKKVNVGVEIIAIEWFDNNIYYTCKFDEDCFYTELAKNLLPIVNPTKIQNNMNIAEILKTAIPYETKLYSTAFGNVTLREVLVNGRIEVMEDDGTVWRFNSDGSLRVNGECMLFPSKENRDWSKFKVEPHFPTTYEECSIELNLTFKECKYSFLLGATDDFGKMVDYKDDGLYFSELNALYKLLICRDAWWKVDNNWKPNWDDNKQDKHYISSYDNRFSNHSCNSFNRIMVFSTAEIRDKFFDTFKHLIKQCKELL